MIGLLQIMIYLFCIYLCYKGAEIFQIAFVSTPGRNRNIGMILGVVATIGAFVVGGVTVFFTESMVAQLGQSMQNLPKFP